MTDQALNKVTITQTELDKIMRGKNINFLIGAGASAPLYKTLKEKNDAFSFEEIITYLDNVSEDHVIAKKDLSINDVQDVQNIKDIMYVYYFMNWIYPMYDELDIDKNGLTETTKNYENLINALYQFLQNESNDRPKRINIFTTNYDLLFEKTFDQFLIKNPLTYFNDGSRGIFKKYISNKNFYLNVTHSGYNDNYRREIPTINLFKLHGSISWKLSDKNDSEIMVCEKNDLILEIKKNIGDLFKDQNWQKTQEEIKKIIENNPSLDDNSDQKNEKLKVLVEGLSSLVKDSKIPPAFFDDFQEKYRQLLIIDPSKHKFWKTVAEQHYYQSIRSFSYELEKEHVVLIVFAFSFADEHLRDIFKRSLLNPTLIVIFICYEEENQKWFKDNWFKGYQNIIFLPKEFSSENKGDFKYLLSLLGFLSKECIQNSSDKEQSSKNVPTTRVKNINE